MPPLFSGLRPVRRPIHRLRQKPVGNDARFPARLLRAALAQNLVGLLPVARPVRQLEVVEVAGVAAAAYRDNVIDARAERMRIL